MKFKQSVVRAAAAAFFCTAPSIFAQVADFQWSMTADGMNDFRVTAADASVFSGSLPSDDPTLNLIIGRRYRVTEQDPVFHPFTVIAKGGSAAQDSALLTAGASTGSLESDAGIAWNDDAAGHLTFTVTQKLVTAMRTNGRIPGYRCAQHTTTMRGNFNITSPAPDGSWTFDSNEFEDYLLSVASPGIYGGQLPASDPTLNLELNKRYRVTITNFMTHPFDVLAKSSDFLEDVVLLNMGDGAGPLSFEDDPGVAWVDDGAGHVEFTVTQALLNAMNAAGHNPGYRCDNHADTMRGDFNITTGTPTPTPTLSPTPSPTPTLTPTLSPTPTLTPEPTQSPTPSLTPTLSPTPTPTGTAGGRAVGDFNNSGCTDLSDFLFLLDNWQLPVNGTLIGLDDFLALLDFWQTGPSC